MEVAAGWQRGMRSAPIGLCLFVAPPTIGSMWTALAFVGPRNCRVSEIMAARQLEQLAGEVRDLAGNKVNDKAFLLHFAFHRH